MSPGGTDRYDLTDPSLPPLVVDAVVQARACGFGLSAHPATGALLARLAAGLPSGALVGETGTGVGVGLAWMTAAAGAGVRLVSCEIDPVRAAAAAEVFADHPGVEVLCGDVTLLAHHAPFDLLVLDGGPWSGKGGDAPVDVASVLRPGGLVTVDDITPMSTWPPLFQGQVDQARVHWLTHPDLLATEIPVTPDLAVIVGRRRPAGS